jgi:hypothetical protein
MLRFIRDYIKYVMHVLRYDCYDSLNILRYYHRRRELNFWIKCVRDLRRIEKDPKFMSKQAWLDKYNTTNTLRVHTYTKTIEERCNEFREARKLKSRIAK